MNTVFSLKKTENLQIDYRTIGASLELVYLFPDSIINHYQNYFQPDTSVIPDYWGVI